MDETLRYYYGTGGQIAEIGYQKGDAPEKTYFFTRNLQGDIIGIYNASNSKLVGTYSYDAWGRPLDVNGTRASETSDPDNILQKNPYRYRGYRYDQETGFYYLNSRFYDPEVKRFLSSDVYAVVFAATNGITDKNLYNYCDNNPVMRADDSGHFWHVVIGAVVGGGMELAGQLMSGKSLKEVNWAKVGVSALSGGVSAAVPGGFITAAVIGGTTDVAFDMIDGNINSVGDAAKSFAWGAAKEVVSQGVGKALDKGIGKLAGKFAGKSGTASNDKVYFGQQAVSPNFSPQGTFKGASIQSVADRLASGELSADNLPIEYIVRDGKMITMNNRSLTALSKANMKPTVLIDITGDVANEAKLTQRLSEMGGQPSESILIRKIGEIVHLPN